ncbi:MAG: hypothetical protein K9J21_06970 [Bacteroidales bacterium]|nr:hypothetical protein [Bacteroidales bacterium]
MEILQINFNDIDWSTVISILLAILTTFFGGYLAKYKKKFKQFVGLTREVVELGEYLNKSLQDNKISDKEISRIKKEYNDVKIEWRKLLNKNE